jgi:hypothetical protein
LVNGPSAAVPHFVDILRWSDWEIAIHSKKSSELTPSLQYFLIENHNLCLVYGLKGDLDSERSWKTWFKSLAPGGAFFAFSG